MFDPISDRDVPLVSYVKLFGALCVIFGAVELGVGSTVYTFFVPL
jgi:hypothetical protein